MPLNQSNLISTENDASLPPFLLRNKVGGNVCLTLLVRSFLIVKKKFHISTHIKECFFSKFQRSISTSLKVLKTLIPTLLIYSLNLQALTATTVNQFQGDAPYLLLSDGKTKLTNLDELMGFSIPNENGGRELITANDANKAIIAPMGMKYSDVSVLVKANGQLQELSTVDRVLVGDENGDASIPANTSVTGSMKATWYDGGIRVPESALSQTLNVCGGPYVLKIEVPTEVKAITRYGLPNMTDYGTGSEITYTFITKQEQGICNLQPGDMRVYTASPILYSSGYNSAVWDKGSNNPSSGSNQIGGGFKRNSGFPSTGFKGAAFSLVGSGNDQSKYRCRSNDNGGKITLSTTNTSDFKSGTDCTVTYNSKTKSEFTQGGTPLIVLEYYNGESWSEVDSYQIPVPEKWAIVKDGISYARGGAINTSTSFPAFDACREEIEGTLEQPTTQAQIIDNTDGGKAWRQKYMYRREEITNNPNTNISFTNVGGYYSRDIGTFLGEWGYIYNYSVSSWSKNKVYWTAELFSATYTYYIDPAGLVNYTSPNYAGTAICRGD